MRYGTVMKVTMMSVNRSDEKLFKRISEAVGKKALTWLLPPLLDVARQPAKATTLCGSAMLYVPGELLLILLVWSVILPWDWNWLSVAPLKRNRPAYCGPTLRPPTVRLPGMVTAPADVMVKHLSVTLVPIAKFPPPIPQELWPMTQ
jgi:hypothetical protein